MRVAEEEVISSFTFAHEPQHFPLSPSYRRSTFVFIIFSSLSLSLSPSFFSGIGTLCLHSLSRFLSAEWRRSSLSSFFSGQPAAVRRFYFVQRKRQSQQLSAGRRLASREREREREKQTVSNTGHRTQAQRERGPDRESIPKLSLFFLSLSHLRRRRRYWNCCSCSCRRCFCIPGSSPSCAPFPFLSILSLLNPNIYREAAAISVLQCRKRVPEQIGGGGGHHSATASTCLSVSLVAETCTTAYNSKHTVNFSSSVVWNSE